MISVAVAGGAFLVGAAMTLGYVQWNSQKQQLAMMTQMVEQMGQQPVAASPAVNPDTVTRSELLDLLALSSVAKAEPTAPALVSPVAAPVLVSPTVANAPVSVAAVPQTAEELDQSTADKLRALGATSAEPTALSALDAKAIADARRLETFAILQAGVQELVAAVVAGEYDIHTNYEDEHFSGRIHFAFVGYEEDQAKLESFLGKAADDGIVAHSEAVVDVDGSVNGHILLFDLVERALENGTLEEQRAGQKMRREAVAMLAKDNIVGQVTEDASGERFYTVESGDSLAFIALQFYGNTNSYVRIFQANRNQLNTPDRIRVGQRLLIPQA